MRLGRLYLTIVSIVCLSSCTNDQFAATSTPEEVTYTVYYFDGDSNLLYEVHPKIGEAPTYLGSLPTKTKSEGLFYQFDTWELIEVSFEPFVLKFKATFQSCSEGLSINGNTATSFSGSAKDVYVPSKWNNATISVIGDRCFDNCKNVQRVHLPNTIREIENLAFYQCSSLESFDIPDLVTTINFGTFWGTSLKSVEFPDSIVSVGGGAYYCCKELESVYINAGLKEIGYEAFYSCESLTNIYFQGTIESWSSISFGEDWNLGILAKVVHCTDGDLPL